jgi:hypothetical protein
VPTIKLFSQLFFDVPQIEVIPTIKLFSSLYFDIPTITVDAIEPVNKGFFGLGILGLG